MFVLVSNLRLALSDADIEFNPIYGSIQ